MHNAVYCTNSDITEEQVAHTFLFTAGVLLEDKMALSLQQHPVYGYEFERIIQHMHQLIGRP